MILYVVGSPEPLFQVNFLKCLSQREFTKEEIIKNFLNLNEYYFFTDKGEAFDYARSLRIQRPVKPFLTADSRKVAPVIEVSFIGNHSLFPDESKKTGKIVYFEYENMYMNDPIQDKVATISFYKKNRADIDPHYFELRKAYFPDLNYDFIVLEQPENQCKIL